jgi:hypothetical protein
LILAKCWLMLEFQPWIASPENDTAKLEAIEAQCGFYRYQHFQITQCKTQYAWQSAQQGVLTPAPTVSGLKLYSRDSAIASR